MSTPNQTLMSPTDAYNVLVGQIHAPVFFEKLARVYNIVPKSENEARKLLYMAGQLRNADDQEQVKQAAAQSSLIDQAANDLDNVLNEYGYTQQQAANPTIKMAADRCAQNPLIREAALVLQHYLSSNNG